MLPDFYGRFSWMKEGKTSLVVYNTSVVARTVIRGACPGRLRRIFEVFLPLLLVFEASANPLKV